MVTITGSRPSASRGSASAADFGHREEVDLEDVPQHRGIVGVELARRADAGVVDDQVERPEVAPAPGRRAVAGRPRPSGRPGTVMIRRRVSSRRATSPAATAASRSAERPVRMTVRPARTRCSARRLSQSGRSPGDQASCVVPRSSSGHDGTILELPGGQTQDSFYHVRSRHASRSLPDRGILDAPFDLRHGGRASGSEAFQ